MASKKTTKKKAPKKKAKKAPKKKATKKKATKKKATKKRGLKSVPGVYAIHRTVSLPEGPSPEWGIPAVAHPSVAELRNLKSGDVVFYTLRQKLEPTDPKSWYDQGESSEVAGSTPKGVVVEFDGDFVLLPWEAIYSTSPRNRWSRHEEGMDEKPKHELRMAKKELPGRSLNPSNLNLKAKLMR